MSHQIDMKQPENYKLKGDGEIVCILLLPPRVINNYE